MMVVYADRNTAVFTPHLSTDWNGNSTRGWRIPGSSAGMTARKYCKDAWRGRNCCLRKADQFAFTPQPVTAPADSTTVPALGMSRYRLALSNFKLMYLSLIHSCGSWIPNTIFYTIKLGGFDGAESLYNCSGYCVFSVNFITQEAQMTQTC